MIPVDEAIGEVLKQATPLEAVTLRLAVIPPGKCLLEVVLIPEAPTQRSRNLYVLYVALALVAAIVYFVVSSSALSKK